MKPKRLISLLVAVCMMVALLPVSAVTAFAADIPALGEDEFNYQGLRYKKLSSSTVSVVGPVEVQTERVIPETVVNNGTTYTVTEIGPYAFSRDTTKSKYTAFVGYPDFKSVTIPSTVTVLRTNAFAGGSDFNDYDTDKGLQSVIFAPGSQLKTIEDGAFAGSYTLKGEFILPNTVESIGDDAFDGCQFEKFTFQEGSQLKSIGVHAFHWLGKVKSFSLPAGVTTIPDYAFWACTSLTEFVLPDGVQTIGNKAFGHCYDLQAITIPRSVKSIADDIFEGDTKITTIYYDGTESDWLKLSNGNSALEHLTVYYASNVSFNLNGHGETTPETQKVYTSKTATKLADPKSNGYIFTGWYTDKECTNPFDFNTAITKDITLYAGWEAIPDHELTVKVGTFTYDDNAASDKGNVYEGALVTVTFDENNQLWKDSGLSFDHWDIQSKAKLLDENGEEIVNPGKTFTFVMPKEGVTIEAMPKDATIEEEEEPNVLGTAAIIGTAAVGTAVLGYQAYSLGTEFAGKLMALPYFPSNRSALAMMLWEDAGKPMPESELLYPDVEQEERDMDLQHAARWAMENELIPDLNDEGTAPEEMKFFPANPVSKLDVLNAWQKAQELKNN